MKLRLSVAIPLLFAGIAGAQPSCIPASTREYFQKSASPSKPRRWLGAGDAQGRLLVVAIDDSIWSNLTAFDVETGHVKWTKPLLGQPSEIRVSPDGKRLALAAATTFCRAPKIQLWDAQSGEQLPKLSGWVDQQGYSVAFSADSKLLAGSMNGQVAVWDAASGKSKVEIQPPGFETRQGIERISNLEFDAQGSALSGANPRGAVYTWSVESGKLMKKTEPPKAAQPETPVAKGTTYMWPAEGGYWKLVGTENPPAVADLKLALVDGRTGKTRQTIMVPGRPATESPR